MADYNRAIELDSNPGNATVFIRRASAYRGKRDHGRAIHDLDEALKLEPRNFRALSSRCFTRAIVGAFDSALADCNEALRIRPDDAAILNTRGFAYLKKGSLDEAMNDYDAALRIDAKQANSLYGRAVAKRLKADAGSERDFAAALAIRPNVADDMARYGIK